MMTQTSASATHESRISLLQLSRHLVALDAITLALGVRPHDTHLRLLASDRCQQLGALPEAADHLLFILIREPAHTEANRRLARLLGELGDAGGAARCWQRVRAAGGWGITTPSDGRCCGRPRWSNGVRMTHENLDAVAEPHLSEWLPDMKAFYRALLLVSIATAWVPASEARPSAALASHGNLPLWDAGHVPGAAGNGPLDAPFLTVFEPREGTANGGAVVVAPGGGNIMLMYGGEGADIAEVFNDWGVTAFVLTYRLSPRYDNAARTLDGKRALQLVRAHAAEWHLDPARIGFIGFSAGGHMGRSVVATSGPGDAKAIDPIERVSSRPDYVALVYGAGQATSGESLKDFPPTFLLSAAADQGPSLANAQLFTDLTKAGAIAELHVYQRGRHGFGSGHGSPEFGDWMPRLEHFLRVGGFLPAAPANRTPASRTKAAPKPVVLSPVAPVNDGHGDYVYVPAGAFEMGDDTGDGLARERPLHVVELDAFYIGKFEVTNAEWKKFRDDAGYDDVRFWPNGRVVPRDQIPYWTQANNHGGGTPDTDAYPALGVNWDAATAYCAWLSARTGKVYRLPTEAEWEKAARGTDRRRYPWGQTIDHGYANFVGAQPFDTVQPVGYYDGSTRGTLRTHRNASPYGAFDMAGNVMEWCQDWYGRDYYAASPRENPKGPETGVYRVLRGGSFFVEAHDLRVYGRSAAWPSLQGHRMIGFRAVREP